MIGDVLVSSLLCEQVKSKYPTSKIHYIANEGTLSVLENNPFVDEVKLFKNSFKKSKIDFFKFLISIQKEKYSLVIDVYAKLESKLITLFSGAPKKISYQKSWSNLFYTYQMKKPNVAKTNIGLTIEERLSLLKPIGIEDNYSKFPKLYITDKEELKIREKLGNQGLDLSRNTYMLSIIGSSNDKTYPLNYMAKVVDTIAEERDCNILFNYIPNQLSQAKSVYELCDERTKNKIYFDVLGSDLREFILIMSQCSAIIGNDGGAINMAKALNKPSFIIFSPWINKESWNTYEDGKYHRTVHLKDFSNHLNGLSRKEKKTQTKELYSQLTPDLFREELLSFMSFIEKEDLSIYTLDKSIIIY